eukprot:TRINITY_DN63741_c0_g1_i1.p1 TRINITY_DN63741_c0_g1~~TRINITY_DN63741_c0_g1_i1.p1  ORF type:complete len:355 (+),score=65.79 TRINITY_DN63741_c0_g1_i1:109-1173(+)
MSSFSRARFSNDDQYEGPPKVDTKTYHAEDDDEDSSCSPVRRLKTFDSFEDLEEDYREDLEAERLDETSASFAELPHLKTHDAFEDGSEMEALRIPSQIGQCPTAAGGESQTQQRQMMVPMAAGTPAMMQMPMVFMAPVISLQQPMGQEMRTAPQVQAAEQAPFLLGRVSPQFMVQNRPDMETLRKPDPVEALQAESASLPLPLGAFLVREVTNDGIECIRWSVDGRKLNSQDKQILSSEFELFCPGQGLQPFRLMIKAASKDTRAKGGFLKAAGFGRLYIKCESSLPFSGNIAFIVTVGGRSLSGTSQARPIWINFAEKNCCALQNEDEFWDLKAALNGETRRFEVCVQAAHP